MKVRQRTVFYCKVCNKYFFKQEDCEKHEAAHYGLTRKNYLLWWDLYEEWCHLSHLHYRHPKYAHITAAYDNNVKAIESFGKKHKLLNAYTLPLVYDEVKDDCGFWV